MKEKYLISKKTKIFALVIIIVLAVIPYYSGGQQPTTFVLVECMKVKPENENLYLSVEKDIWKPIHQERVNQGKILGWVLYRVHYTGSNDEYNYATGTIFSGLSSLENPYEGIDIEQMVPDMEWASSKTLKSRELVKRNLIRLSSFAYPENSMRPAPYKYIEVNFMKRNTGNYVQAAREIYQPIHQEFVNSGSRAGWSLFNAVYPRGAESDFHFVAVNYYSDFSQLGSANMVEAFKKAHPNKDRQKELGGVYETRTMVKSELWEVVDQVMLEQ